MDLVGINQVRAKIKEEIARLDGDIQRLREVSKPVAPDNAIGRLSRMDAINSKSINEANLRSAQERLVNLKKTLLRIDHEDFGCCIECDESIPLLRLLAIPENALCVACAGKRDRR